MSSPKPFRLTRTPSPVKMTAAEVAPLIRAARPIGVQAKGGIIMVGSVADLVLLCDLLHDFPIDWLAPGRLGRFADRLEKIGKYLCPNVADRVDRLARFFRACLEAGMGVQVKDVRPADQSA